MRIAIISDIHGNRGVISTAVRIAAPAFIHRVSARRSMRFSRRRRFSPAVRVTEIPQVTQSSGISLSAW
jgi:hypothetical protein